MNKGRCIGLFGGLGVGAAIHYYQKLSDAHAARSLVLDLVMVHADMARIPRAIEANDPAALAQYFNEILLRLQAAGAEFAVLPSVTSHYPLDQLREISSLPLIDIFAPLNRELAARNIRRVAAFGTRYVLETRLYGRVPGVEFGPATPHETELIHNMYMELAWRGRGTPDQFTAFTQLAQELIRREQLDAILLAGTDLSLLFDDTNTAFPAIDCAALHIAAIADQAAKPH